MFRVPEVLCYFWEFMTNHDRTVFILPPKVVMMSLGKFITYLVPYLSLRFPMWSTSLPEQRVDNSSLLNIEEAQPKQAVFPSLGFSGYGSHFMSTRKRRSRLSTLQSFIYNSSSQTDLREFWSSVWENIISNS